MQVQVYEGCVPSQCEDWHHLWHHAWFHILKSHFESYKKRQRNPCSYLVFPKTLQNMRGIQDTDRAHPEKGLALSS